MNEQALNSMLTKLYCQQVTIASVSAEILADLAVVRAEGRKSAEQPPDPDDERMETGRCFLLSRALESMLGAVNGLSETLADLECKELTFPLPKRHKDHWLGSMRAWRQAQNTLQKHGI
jgi:hypothetical protein